MIETASPVAAQIRITDLGRARQCVQWLIEHIGPDLGVLGSMIRGTGWQVRTYPGSVAEITLTHDVDEQDIVMFLLRWS